jgi:N-acetylglucosaminyl-diphospho-decaprenol L-rhamnosyltransferase
MANHEITVVITTFRSDIKIISCLNSIKGDIKVLIVENSNRSDFKEKIESKYPNTTCLLAGENLGYAKGNNLGLSKVETKYALILNPDAILEKTAIDNFFNATKKNENFAIIAPSIQEEKEINSKINESKTKLIPVKNVKGFAMFLNLKQFENIGFFDDNFFIYFEEIDLCNRLIKEKKEIFLDPNIRIYHSGGSSHDDSINYNMELSRNWHWMWSTFYFNKKYNGYFLSLIKILPKLFSAIFKTFLYFLIFNKNKMNIYYQRASGIINSILGKKSWYRPKVF